MPPNFEVICYTEIVIVSEILKCSLIYYRKTTLYLLLNGLIYFLTQYNQAVTDTQYIGNFLKEYLLNPITISFVSQQIANYYICRLMD